MDSLEVRNIGYTMSIVLIYLKGMVGVGHVYSQLVCVKFDILSCVVFNFMGVIMVQPVEAWYSTMIACVTGLVDVNKAS